MILPKLFGFAESNLHFHDEAVVSELSNISSEVRAAITWSIACEPGDELAGYLRDALGVSRALELIRSQNLQRVLGALYESGNLGSGQSRFGDLERVVSASFERYLPRISTTAVSSALAALQANRGWVVLPQDEDWPSGLDDLGWATPPLIWGLGDRSQLPNLSRSVSIVGSRGATTYGEWATVELVGELVANGYAIVSGGAYGIDGIAHKATIKVRGSTFAVMAGGVNRFYPAGNELLLSKVREHGAVLAELPPGAMPTKWRFLQRNRLVAALSRVTVVVEAGKRSGSISTANHALAIGRPVGAVPGPITSTASFGTNRLIADGFATLVTNASEVCLLAGDSNELQLETQWQDLGGLEKRALDAIGKKPMEAEDIAIAAGLSTSEASIALSNLLLLGQVTQANGRWCRVSTKES